jgi:hypothetical protein
VVVCTLIVTRLVFAVIKVACNKEVHVPVPLLETLTSIYSYIMSCEQKIDLIDEL